MRNLSAKISLFILIGIMLTGCNAVKRVPANRHLLTKNTVMVNGKREKAEVLQEQLLQKPNSRLLGYSLRLNIYNLAKVNPDSSYQAKFIKNPARYRRLSKILSKKQVNRLGKSFYYFGVHNFLKKLGEPPVVIDEKSAKKSASRLRGYYINNGYFNAGVRYVIDTTGKKRAAIAYELETGPAFTIDSISRSITSAPLDSLYQQIEGGTLLKKGDRFRTANFDTEKERITTYFRNHGAYEFEQSYVKYNIDTIGKKNQADVKLLIGDYNYRKGDTTQLRPFRLYKISQVNIYSAGPNDKTFTTITDSTTYKDFNLYSSGKLRYRPKALTNAVFITKGSDYADFRTTLTSRYLNNLRVFNYPSIQYKVDSTGNGLIADIYLVSRPKFSFGYGIDFTHSNIQDFGISGNTSVAIRNIFNGAETLELALRGNIGSSQDFANPDNTFFNVFEYGADLRLSFPRILFPVKTERIIPQSMIPSTFLSFGIAKQTNIGLDKENFTGALTYNWTPKRYHTARLDLFNIQYVNNVNIGNYFNVYRSSYQALNRLAEEYNAPAEYLNNSGDLRIPGGADAFINDVLSNPPAIPMSQNDFRQVVNINERKGRLTENNLIFASSFIYTKTTRTDLLDDNFYILRGKLESAGNTLSLLANLSKELKSQEENRTILGVVYSQYFKAELEYIKHFDMGRKKVFAIRTFAAVAIPYGNSDNVPFSRSYFAGGSNDIRAWQSYGLGPGRSRTFNDFNEANMKLTFSAEYRFNLFGNFNAALFADVGNIWNVLDNVTDERAVFHGFKSLNDLAVGSGVGFRYDFGLFVMRIDTGFKTFNPASDSRKWFSEYNFANSTLNVGINYPF